MAYLQRSLAFTLSAQPWKERDKKVIFYSARYGKISAIVRGVRKLTSHYGPLSEPLVESEIELYEKREEKGIHRLTHARIVNLYPNWRKDWNQVWTGLYIAEITELLSPWNEPNSLWYRLLKGIVKLLEQGKDGQLLALGYLERCLRLNGLGLETDKCVRCGGTVIEKAYQVRDGGIACERCHQTNDKALSDDIWQGIKRLKDKNFWRDNLTVEAKRGIREILEDYSQQFFEVAPKTNLFGDNEYEKTSHSDDDRAVRA